MTDLPQSDPHDPLAQAVERVLEEQRRFEARRSTRMGTGTEKVTAPASRLLRRFLPPGMMRRALMMADQGAGRTLPEGAGSHDLDDIDACEAAALRVQKWSVGSNAATGGLAGWFGGPGAMFDVPATLLLAARNVRATGAAYGFAGNDDDERLFRLQILELATVQGMEARGDAMGRINRLARQLNEPEVRFAADRAVDWVFDKVIDRVARGLSVDLLRRKAAQVVPLAGGLIGAGVNASFQTDVSRAARWAYRQRWLMHRKVLPAPPAPATSAGDDRQAETGHDQA